MGIGCSMSNEAKSVVITKINISTPAQEVFAMCKDDIRLKNIINLQKKKCQAADIEVFETNQNIIATEEGYYCAFYAEDLIMEKDIK